MTDNEVLVMCLFCNRMARFDFIPGTTGRIWHWHEPCRFCGRENYGSIMSDRYLELYGSDINKA